MNYDESWRDLRARIRLFYGVWLGGMPVIMLVVIPLSRVFRNGALWAGGGLGILWVAGFSAAGIYRQLFNCPRCGKRFFWGPWWHNPYARKCLNCGLKRWGTAGDNPN